MLFPILSLEQHTKQHHHLVVLFCITRLIPSAMLCPLLKLKSGKRGGVVHRPGISV